MKLPFTTDKIHHFVYSFFICTILCSLLSFLDSGKVIAFGITLAIGIAKEVWDSYNPNANAEMSDITADIFGTAFAVAIVIISKSIGG